MIINLTLLLASAGLAADVASEEFPMAETEPSLLAPTLLLVSFMLLGIATVWGGLYFAMRWHKAQNTRAPERRSLIDRLASLHQLSAEDLQQLRSLAARLSLADAALLFIDPRLLETCLEQHPEMTDWTTHIGRKLFGAAFPSPSMAEKSVTGVA